MFTAIFLETLERGLLRGFNVTVGFQPIRGLDEYLYSRVCVDVPSRKEAHNI